MASLPVFAEECEPVGHNDGGAEVVEQVPAAELACPPQGYIFSQLKIVS